MAKKIDMELLKTVMRRTEVDARIAALIIEELQQEIQEQEQEKEPTPQLKKQFAILVSDPEGHLEGLELAGWVVQLPEDTSPLTTVESITAAAYDFNQTPKGRRMPVCSIGEACEAVPARFFKEQQVWVKTKEAVMVVRTDNKIAFDKSAARMG